MEDNRIYVGIIMMENGWNKLFSDGNKHYTFEPLDNEEEKNKTQENKKHV